MNTGTLITEAGQQPRNMKHFVVDNQCYQTVETMPMVNQDGADYTMMARGAGFQRAVTIDNLAELERKMPEIVAAPGPYFIRLRIEAEPDYQRAPPATYEGPEMKYRFGRAMEKKLGIKVFGPRGILIASSGCRPRESGDPSISCLRASAMPAHRGHAHRARILRHPIFACSSNSSIMLPSGS